MSTGVDLCHEEFAAHLRGEFLRKVREGMEAERAVAEEWRASIVRRQAEFLIQLIDQRIERALVLRKSGRLGRVAHLFGNLFHFRHRAAPAAVQKAHHGDLKFLRDAGFDLQLATAIFELAQAPFEQVTHSQSSSNSDADNANPEEPGRAPSK